MSVFKVDASGARVREGGAFVRIDGAPEIAQGIQTGIAVQRGEYAWNIRLGFPWLSGRGVEGLLAKGVPGEVLASRVRADISKRPGVVDVTKLELREVESRVVAIEYQALISTSALAQAILVQATVPVQS